MALHRAAWKTWWLGAGVFALTAVCALGPSGRAEASGGTPFGVTYTGTTSVGGSITVALSQDQSTVLWVSLDSIDFPNPCLSASITTRRYASPPEVLVDQSFQLILPFWRSGVAVSGSVVSETSLAGTASFSSGYPVICPGDAITWSAEAAGLTAPGKLDRHYTGALGTGAMSVWTRPGGQVSAIDIDDVSLSPCSDPYVPVEIKATFDPPLPNQSGSLDAALEFIPDWGHVFIEGSFVDINTIAATVTLWFLTGQCSASWTGVLASPDADADGCIDFAEQQTTAGSEMSGGRRDAKNSHDYMNPTHDGQNRIDDVLAVVGQYFKDDADGNPGLPPYEPGYDPDTDRTDDPGSSEAWDLLGPNGQQRIDDILAVIKQYFHDCA